MSKYILLTGGTGFIGSHLLEELLNLNKKVILLKRSFSNTWRISEYIENKNLIIKDVDKVNLNDIFTQFDIEGIFHLAAFSLRVHNYNSVSEMVQSNIEFPTLLLENSVNSNTKFFVNTGSFFEYNLSSSPIYENSNLKPFNLYGSTKIAFENILKFYFDNYALNCQTLKLFTPYGSKDDENKLIPYLIINLIKKNNIFIKSPKKKLDFIYVKDIVNAYIKVMDNILNLHDYNSLNVGTGIGTTILDVFKIIESELGNYSKVIYGDIETEQVYCSNNKIREILNWNPKTKLEDGLKETIHFYYNYYNEI